MIGITVVLAAALAFSLSSTTSPRDRVNTDIAVENGSELTARHVGGEDVPVEGSVFVFTFDDGEKRVKLADVPGDVDENRADRWELGEQVCLSCAASDHVEALTFATQDQIVVDWSDGR